MADLAKILKKETGPPASVAMTMNIFTESHIVAKKYIVQQFIQSSSIIAISLLTLTNWLPTPISLSWHWLVPDASEKDDNKLVLNNYATNCP